VSEDLRIIYIQSSPSGIGDLLYMFSTEGVVGSNEKRIRLGDLIQEEEER
jgi:hypothetical protein